jgi:PPIC-type PPIASE domain
MTNILNGRTTNELEEIKSNLNSNSLTPVISTDDWSDATKELLDSLPRVWTRGMLYFLVTFVSIVLPWAMLSKVDETGSARGRLEPFGATQRLDAPVAGTVTAVRVKEGEEEKVYTTLLANKLAQHLFANKVEPYFFQHQLDYAGVVMYEVVLDDEDLALELFYAVKEGEMSFYDVARQYIQDVELRRKGGYLGMVRRKDLKAEISAAVFAAKPPQLLKPIVTARGFHLILVEEIIHPQLDEKLYQKIASELFSEWLKEQTGQIVFNLKFD